MLTQLPKHAHATNLWILHDRAVLLISEPNVLRHFNRVDYSVEFSSDHFTYSNNNHVQAVPGILEVRYKTQADCFKEKLQSKHHSKYDV